MFGVAAAVAAADVALCRGSTTEIQLASFCSRLVGTKGVDRARRSVRLANRLSESPGESWSAVVIDDLGFPAPERQHEIWDRDGLAGRSDFWWEGSRVVGEFDGRVKYGRESPAGRAPEDVLWAEKRREDRIRATGVTVARWTAAELARPARLAELLGAALGGRSTK